MKAWKLAQSEANASGQEVLKHNFALMVGVDYNEIKAAVAIYDNVIKHPKRYEDVYSIRGAYVELLKANAQYVNQLAAEKNLSGIHDTQRGATPLVIKTDPNLTMNHS